MSSTNATTSSANDDLPKAVITLGVLGGALVIGLIIAKLADYCYERSSVRDDASDISEHTKELLRTQLELMRMGKSKDRDKFDKIKGEPEEQTTKAMAVWSSKVKAKGKLNPIPEGTEAYSAANTPQPPSNTKSTPEVIKAWNEAEKDTPQPKPSIAVPSTSKASPAKKKSNATDPDDEFQVPSNISAPSKGRANAKNSTILVPANLNKDVNIRAITPVSSQKSFSRYITTDASRPTTAKSASPRPTTAKSTPKSSTATKPKSWWVIQRLLWEFRGNYFSCLYANCCRFRDLGQG